MSVMMIALSGCQTYRRRQVDLRSYDEHYQKNETTLKEDALSDRWESRGSKVAVVSKKRRIITTIQKPRKFCWLIIQRIK